MQETAGKSLSTRPVAVFLLQQSAFLFVLPVPKNKIRKELSEQFL
jgi:hypothetical protein